MLRTMDNVTVFFGLLVLFIFIFSCLGMVLFGYKFCIHNETGLQCTCKQIFNNECSCDRTNFDSFHHATVTVFQASQELKQALAEEERRNEQKQNTCFRKFLRKTCLYQKAEYSLFCFGPKNPFRIRCNLSDVFN
ncbi:hypothetical protein TELCIR_06661 [Teladorsagia circumcincta]|uniref:Ion transport domain-containing protein n=1 Tax=Teladorsagia circumcincta TaxID=45464 RepID=A0A2G9UMQ1_TELCI|nr:hypothetical protein TELCIR_06661 [Teladorsagia circumcincta]